jgi:hypothetical protein
MERARRVDAESVCAGSESVRIEFWVGRGDVGEFVRCLDWNGNGWLDCVSFIGERVGGH